MTRLALLTGIATLAVAVPVVAATPPPFDLPQPSDAALASSISDIVLLVDDIVLPAPGDLVRESTDDGERVIGLDADLMFAFDSADVSPAAAARVDEIVQDLPTGAAVEVAGHTDSIGSDADNLALSQRRAEAVADILRASRPDLVLDVRGYGESDPVAPNTTGGQDDPEGRALNRRVELRIDG